METLTQTEQPLTCTRVPSTHREYFLPRLFGEQYMLTGESLVYRTSSYLFQNYNGGYWNFFNVSNGAQFMAPESSEPLILDAGENYHPFCGETVSDEVAGLLATSMALSNLSFVIFERKQSTYHVADKFYLLQQFIGQHDSAKLIYSVLD